MQQKTCRLSIRRKSVTKLKVTPKGRKKTQKEKWAPKSIEHSFDVLKASAREEKEPEVKRNERKLCEQLSHVAAFDTLLAFVNAMAGFFAARRRGSGGFRN